MHRTTLLNALSLYQKSLIITPEEHPVLQQLLCFVEQEPYCFERSTKGHITASAWIVDYEKKHVLLTHHKKLNIWLQLGGHADGDSNTVAVALKEAEEESGITGFTFLSETIFDIDIHPIPTACTTHYDIRYLLQAPQGAQFIVSEESHNLAWVPFTLVHDYAPYRSIARMNKKCALFL